MGQGCSPPEETVKNPGGPALILAWSIVTDGPDRTLLPLRPPRCTPLSRSRHTSCLGLLVLPSRVEGWSTEHSFVDTWVPALGDLGQAVDLLGLSVLTAKFRPGAREPPGPCGPHGGQLLLRVLLATVAPSTGSISWGGSWFPAGPRATCPFPQAAPQADLGLAGAVAGKAMLIGDVSVLGGCHSPHPKLAAPMARF